MSKIIPAKEPSVAPAVTGDYARQECLKGAANAFELLMETSACSVTLSAVNAKTTESV